MALKTLVCRTLRQKNLVNYTPIAIKWGKYSHNEDRRSSRKRLTQVLFGSVLVASTVSGTHLEAKDKNETHDSETVEAGAKKPNLPTYSAEEVSKHNTTDSFWVTYKHGVYDVTGFIPSHPGGAQILNAAGLSIEPFWNIYGMHKTPEVYALLESYRIGNLRDEDVCSHGDDELWSREPARDARLLVRAARPFNAETPAALLVEHFDTPNELFYVRQHMPVPELDPRTHALRVTVRGARATEVTLTMEELARLPQTTVRAALMCAGNRRSEMDKVRPVKGLGWQAGAVSNAVWSGVLLRDVLEHCGVDLADTRGKHVIFTGADIDATGHNFSTSVPLHLAAGAGARALLATAMNGAPLPADHGRPLRAVVPGAPAVRSVKWLESITISEEESSSHWHRQDYRSFNASQTWETADFAAAPPVYSLPVTAVCCAPADGDTVDAKDGYIELRGYAYSGGGAQIVRVDISADRGGTWREARCETADDPPPHHYSWALWTVRVPARRGVMEIWVKATDSNFNTQPEKFDDIWNIRGILGNAYHKIKVHVR